MKSCLITIVILVTGVVPWAQATPISFTSTLSGSFQVPSTSSTATGSGTFILNSAQTDLNYSITFSNLAGTVTDIHFHDAPAGTNGPVVRDNLGGVGLTSGTISGD